MPVPAQTQARTAAVPRTPGGHARTGTAGTAGARRPDRSSPLPLWAQVHADLVRRVAAAEFTDSFPGELALVTEYAVSRHTVREALRRLRADGVVLAERGRAPRLAPVAQIDQPVGALYSLFASVEAAGLVQRSVVRVLDRRTDAVVATRLGLDGSAPLVHLERLRLADEEPLALDRVWLPYDLAAPLLEADFTRTALYDELAARTAVRLTGGEEQIRAVLPSDSERALLACEPGVAAFAVDRVGRSGDRTIEWRQSLVRGDRFTLSADFSAGSGYRLSTTPKE